MSDFTLGEHEARLKRIEQDVCEIKHDVHKLVVADARRQGAWKVAAAIGGAAGSVLAAVFKVFGG